MGTRADFYLGTGANAEWLGSIAYDGYRIHEAEEAWAAAEGRNADDKKACWAIKSATTAPAYRAAVESLLSLNDDATHPEQGWPWPWEDSCTTDRSYCFDGEKTVPFAWGCPLQNEEDGNADEPPKAEWPNMKDRQNVTFGSRSGVMIIKAA